MECIACLVNVSSVLLVAAAKILTVGQHALKNVNNCLISSSLETSGGKSSYLYLNVVHFFNTSVN